MPFEPHVPATPPIPPSTGASLHDIATPGVHTVPASGHCQPVGVQVQEGRKPVHAQRLCSIVPDGQLQVPLVQFARVAPSPHSPPGVPTTQKGADPEQVPASARQLGCGWVRSVSAQPDVSQRTVWPPHSTGEYPYRQTSPAFEHAPPVCGATEGQAPTGRHLPVEPRSKPALQVHPLVVQTPASALIVASSLHV